jgi:hypothetical protein
MKTVWLVILLFAVVSRRSASGPKRTAGQGQPSQKAGKVLDFAPAKVLDLVFRVEDIETKGPKE